GSHAEAWRRSCPHPALRATFSLREKDSPDMSGRRRMTKLRIMVALTVAFTVIAVVPDLRAQFQPQGALGALAPANIAKPRPKPAFNLTGTWLHGGGADNNFRFAPPAGFKLTPAAQRVYDEARKAQAEGKVYHDDIGQCWPSG